MTLEELYDGFGEKMYHYLVLRLGSAEDAEDVLQETFCRLARYSVRWAIIRNPKAFVFSVLRNESNRFLRRRLTHPADSLDPEQQAEKALIMDAPCAGVAAAIAGALAALPEEQKDIVILKIFEDFSFKEIAGICGLSINTAASRYRYALEKLRASMEGKV